MSPSSDVIEFDRRAPTYDDGRLGRWHQLVVTRCADVAMASAPVPLRALDVGCGTGAMLVEFAVRLPSAIQVVGVDPARGMTLRARERAEGRAEVIRAGAEQLPFAEASFDLVVSTLSFDHWADRSQGLREIARVLSPDGTLVLAERCGWWQRNQGGVRHRRQLVRLAEACGFELDRHETVYRIAGLPLVQAFVFAR
jgi:ubiquinone/menaquinone biosynthesis C-methylase UbiE